MHEAFSCAEVKCLGLCDRCRLECVKRVREGRIYQAWSQDHYQRKEQMMNKPKGDPIARLARRFRRLARPAVGFESREVPMPVDESERYVAEITDTLAQDCDQFKMAAAIRRINTALEGKPDLFVRVFDRLEGEGIVSLAKWRAHLRLLDAVEGEEA